MSKYHAHDLRLYAAVRAFVRDDLRRQRRKYPKRTKDQMAYLSIGLCRYEVQCELSRAAAAQLSPEFQRTMTHMP